MMMNQSQEKLYVIRNYYDVEVWNIDRVIQDDNGETRVYALRKDSGSWSASWKLSDIQESSKMAFSEAELQPELERRRALYELKDGQIHCQYCHKAVDEKSAISYRVISYANYGSRGRLGKYCSRDCANFDQMAHEG